MTVDLENVDGKAPVAKRSFRASPHPMDGPCTPGRCYAYLQVSWVWPLLQLGSSRPLEEADVWQVPCSASVGNVGVRAAELWRQERAAAAGRRPRLLRHVLLRVAGHHVARLCCCSLLVAVFFTAAPLLLRRFLVCLQEGASRHQLVAWGVPFVACWFAITFLITIGKWEVTLGACKCRVAVQYLIYLTCLAGRVDTEMSPENLMSVDAERYFVVWQMLFPHCFVLLGSFAVLLVMQVGIVPTVIGMGTLYLTAYGQKRIGGVIGKHRKLTMLQSDHRLRLTQQFMEGIRVLKMNGWTSFAEEQLSAVRTRELSHHRWTLYFRGLNTTLGLASPCVTGFLVFSVYALLGGEMHSDVVFPALTVLRGLQLYMSMLPTIFSAIGEFTAAHERVLAFLASQPLEALDEAAAAGATVDDAEAVALSGARFTRGAPTDGDAERPPFALGPVDLQLCSGELCVVCGPVGSGKSTLLLGLLGELPHEGRAELRGRAALCGQEPWIRSDALRENVRCLRPWDSTAYDSALDAASLRPDLRALPAGDETEIGTRGINISGGQKARVALARSLFGVQSSDVVLLDDVLSAVDAHVARHIIDHALLGAFRSKTRVLVANTFLPLLLPHANQVIVLAPGGAVDAVGTAEEALVASAWLRQAVDAMGGLDGAAAPGVPATSPLLGRGPADLATGAGAKPASGAAPAAPGTADAPAPPPGSLLVAEDRVVGVLDSKAYGSFFKDASSHRTVRAGLLQFGIIVGLVVMTEAARSAADVLILVWTNSEEFQGGRRSSWFWIAGFAGILAVLALFGTIRIVRFTRAIITIGGRTHGRMMRKVLGASVPLFFDVVPTGRILNRFSKDLDSLDAQLPEFMFDFLQSSAYVLAAVALCVSASYFAAAAVVPLLVCFVYVRNYFAAVSRELKRLESVSRSPLYTHFSETLSGLVHIRAMGLVRRMVEQFEAKVDTNAALFLHQQALIPWLVHRVNLIASVLLAVVVAVSIAFSESVNPAMVGLSLASGAGLLGKLHQCVQQSIQTENHFTSVERLEHFDRIQQEEEEEEKEPWASAPAPAWPERGELAFEDVQLRYRPHLPLVLRGVSFGVAAGQRAGLIGRTGSGKSSCMLAVLRLVGLSGGRVRIDGQDLAAVPLARLRGQAVAIIPQEPYLFEGTVRQNLDPFGAAAAQDCEAALQATQLAAVLTPMGGLEARVENNGANLSLGQRQLLCIARAMLRRSRVVLLDEASANIDATTDVLIQQSIRTCFGQSTLLIIAHRLATIADADVVVCMDQGQVVEVGPPAELRQRDGPVAAMFREAH